MIRLARNIRTSGTIVPSSRYLIDRVLQPVSFDRSTTIVELGIGDGCITREILARMGPTSRLISIEIEEEWVVEAEAIGDPRLSVYHACATSLPNVLQDAGLPGADYVISSLPLTILDDRLTDDILTAAEESLNPQGMFIQFQYSPVFFRKFTQRYDDVKVGFTLRNIPPAFVYECVNGVA